VVNQGDTSIRIYPPNPVGTVNEAPLATIIGSNTGLSGPQGVAVDATGKIYVCNTTGGPAGTANGSVTVYAANPSGTVNAAPIAMIVGPNTGMNLPTGIALDASGKIYVADGNTASILVYAANPSGTLNEAPIATIAGSNTQLANPFGIAFDGTGHVYVSNTGVANGSITVYAPNPSGTLNEAPIAEIIGSNTGLVFPQGVAVAPSGKIWAVDNTFGTYAVTAYAANPSGTLNEAPVATISGSATDVSNPSSIATDPSGKVYVGIAGTGTPGIAVFAANANGNQAPTGFISGSNTGLNNPFGVAVH